MPTVILCDFDGTITTQDTLVRILDKFARPDWRIIEKKVRNFRIGCKAGLIEEFALCSPEATTKENILRFLNAEIQIDPYFKDFLRFCKGLDYEFVITSGGFSLCIDAILKKYGIENLPYYANKLLFKKEGLAIEYPYPSDKCDACGNCKTMHLKRYKQSGYYCIYIGDSTTDRCPAKYADLVFAKGHLSKYCAGQNIKHIPFNTFADIQAYIAHCEINSCTFLMTNVKIQSTK